jgi:ABC-type sulfate transport system permease subunit
MTRQDFVLPGETVILRSFQELCMFNDFRKGHHKMSIWVSLALNSISFPINLSFKYSLSSLVHVFDFPSTQFPLAKFLSLAFPFANL